MNHSISELDLHLFAEGTHYRAYDKLGAHLDQREGKNGTRFAVWAPNALEVSVIGDFNSWQPNTHPLQRLSNSGVWEGFIPGVGHGATYKYEIVSRQGDYRVAKSDPYAFAAERPPETASKVWSLEGYDWGDGDWLARRQEAHKLNRPISVYEVHLPSWMRQPGPDHRSLSYRELAPKLTSYLLELGYTHVEFMPLAEFPFEGSWGYQSTGYFAPTARLGTPQDLMYLIDTLHRKGIGVILDWVPGHFPKDEHGLAYFDGSHLYEYEDPLKAEHKEWDTYVFDYEKREVNNFLISNALFWLDKYHIDGLRVDAVASMLHLDYARKPGEWKPNIYGGRENLEAVSFVRRLNELVHAERPDVLTIAEESTAWPMVTRPTDVGGLGFDLKWDLGWMHDTLDDYLASEPDQRKDHHGKLTFRAMYAFSENFMLPLSHDEVTQGKKSLLNRMPGDEWQKFANLRLLHGYQYAQPGKKLLFMGGEFGQWREWNHDWGLDWYLLDQPNHAKLKRWVRDLNTFYRGEPILHQLDCDPAGFEWVDCNDAAQSVLTFLRKGGGPNDLLLFVCNFTPETRRNYRVGVPRGGHWLERLNSDTPLYGGSGQGNMGGVTASPTSWHGHHQSINLTLPPLSIIAFSPQN